METGDSELSKIVPLDFEGVNKSAGKFAGEQSTKHTYVLDPGEFNDLALPLYLVLKVMLYELKVATLDMVTL